MSAVLLAVFDRFSDAENVRTQLVKDGFPTDRVELTARGEKGRAGVQPADSSHQQFLQYYRTLFDQDGERAFVRELADRVADGAIATIVVHPRGDVETSRATQILEREGAQQLAAHDLESQSLERAASPQEGTVLGHLLPKETPGAGRFYFRVFPDEVREQQGGTR
jgi:hypothetical protein